MVLFFVTNNTNNSKWLPKPMFSCKTNRNSILISIGNRSAPLVSNWKDIGCDHISISKEKCEEQKTCAESAIVLHCGKTCDRWRLQRNNYNANWDILEHWNRTWNQKRFFCHSFFATIQNERKKTTLTSLVMLFKPFRTFLLFLLLSLSLFLEVCVCF